MSNLMMMSIFVMGGPRINQTGQRGRSRILQQFHTVVERSVPQNVKEAMTVRIG